ncbi:MAG: DMT family transporter [Anaerovoracaceae bacterium]
MENKIQKKNVVFADIGLLFVAIFWGGGFVAGKFALTDMGPVTLMAYRYGLATVAMLPFCFKQLKLIDKKMLVSGGIIGTIMFIGNSLQTIGLQYTTAGKQTFIISLYTVFVPVITWIFLKARPGKNIIFAAVLALIGISMLTLTDDLTIGFGDWLTLIFAIGFSTQIVLISLFMKDMDPMAFTFVQIAVAGAWSILAGIFFGSHESIFEMGNDGMLGLMYLVFFNTTFAFILQNRCQKIAPPNHVAILISLEVVFGTIFAVTIGGEIFTQRMIIGCIIMFIAIGVSKLPTKKDKGNSI